MKTHHSPVDEIQQLFERCPDLCGFSVQEKEGAADELYVTAVGVSPRLSAEQYGHIFGEIATTLAEMIDERPETCDFLRGRTFARVVH